MDTMFPSTPPHTEQAPVETPAGLFSSVLRTAQPRRAPAPSADAALPGETATAGAAPPLMSDSEAAAISAATSPVLGSLFLGQAGIAPKVAPGVGQTASGTAPSPTRPGVSVDAALGAARVSTSLKERVIEAAVAPVLARTDARGAGTAETAAQVAANAADEAAGEAVAAGASQSDIESRWAAAFLRTYEALVAALTPLLGGEPSPVVPYRPPPGVTPALAGPPTTPPGVPTARGGDPSSLVTEAELLVAQAEEQAAEARTRAQAEARAAAEQAARRAAVLLEETRQFTIYSAADTLAMITQDNTLMLVDAAPQNADEIDANALIELEQTRTLVLGVAQAAAPHGGGQAPPLLGVVP